MVKIKKKQGRVHSHSCALLVAAAVILLCFFLFNETDGIANLDKELYQEAKQQGGEVAAPEKLAELKAHLLAVAARDSETITKDGDNSDNTVNSNKNNKFIKVFIGIKTKEKGLHGHRLPEIQKTWLKDALAWNQNIRIKFFSDQGDGPEAAVSNTTTDDNDDAIDMEPLMVPIAKCRGTDFRCKTTAMFQYFLDNDQGSAFFCNFDDDNYVLIKNLLNVMTGYYNNDGLRDNIYVGRESQRQGFRLKEEFNRTSVHFLTGGAGYCISRDMMERGREYFLNPPKSLPDDIAVGYVVQENMGVTLIQNELFHSHLEQKLQQKMPKSNITKQVSFGFNNKHLREFAREAMPDFPNLYHAKEDDPLFFRSFRCYLLREQAESLNAAETVEMAHCPKAVQ